MDRSHRPSAETRPVPRPSMNGLHDPAVDIPDGAAPANGDPGFDLVVADASWIWTERLFSPLADLGVRTLLLKACDWRTAWNQKKPAREWLCPASREGERLWRRQFILPPGWMKTYPQLGMRPLAWAARRWHRSLPRPRPLALAISYPHYLHLRDLLQPDALLYYNMDDYAFYWASKGDSIRKLERQAVTEADLSVFCARSRADELTTAVPSAESRIVHLPHGAPASSIAQAPQHRPAEAPSDLATLPRPYLGFVGTLEDRLDWDLIGRVADAFPDGSIVLIGREPAPQPGEGWYRAYQTAIAKPNVHRMGWRTQDQIAQYIASFDACLIPYLVDHPFNQASCPTKVMDYMATSRPVVTTALPECRLYDGLFSVAESGDEFVSAIKAIVAKGSDDGLAAERWRTARDSTWERTSEALLRRFQAALATTNC